MTAIEVLRYLQQEIHSTVAATVDREGRPVTCAIDIMAADENGLYFLTAKGKGFYTRLKETEYMALTVFQLYEGSGEWFDLSKKPIERFSFSFGSRKTEPEGYRITEACIGCRACEAVCPQHCIDFTTIPAVILSTHCLHCGNCAEVCPQQAVIRKGAR